MQAMPPGAMLAVRLPETRASWRSWATALDLAAVNAPSLCVAAGPVHEIEALEARLAARDVPCRRLAVSHAFHSRAVDAALAESPSSVPAVRLQPPRIPFVSTRHRRLDHRGAGRRPRLLGPACRAPVRFADALATVAREERPFLLEVGPGRTLSSLAPQIVERSALRGVTASMPDDDAGDLSDATAAVWSAGLALDWSAAGARGRKISLPTYPFQRIRCWIDPTNRDEAAAAATRVAGARDAGPAARCGARRRARPRCRPRSSTSSASCRASPTSIPRRSFVAHGFDSLLLGQAARAIEKKFRTKITFRQLLNETTSAAALAAHLDAGPAGATGAPPPHSATPATGNVRWRDRCSLSRPARSHAGAVRRTAARAARPVAGSGTGRNRPTTDGPAGGSADARPSPRPRAGAIPSRRGSRTTSRLWPQRINARTPLAKARTQRDRDVLADPRTAAGFRREWKELVYPIVAERAKGSKIRDIDGNEYIDLVNGFGQTMFGHSPDFVTEALAAPDRRRLRDRPADAAGRRSRRARSAT